MISINQSANQSINQSITCILIIAVTLNNYLAIKFKQGIKRKYISNKNLQNEINCYNKHIPEEIGLMVKLRRDVFKFIYYTQKLAKLASEIT